MSERIEIVRRLWEQEWSAASLCVCVTGSVARGEETTYSDIDLLIIHQANDDLSTAVSDRIVGAISRSVDHASVAVRSLRDISAMIETDIRSWVAQMDAVFVAGDTSVFCKFRTGLRDAVLLRRTDILAAIEEITESRHRQYGTAVALLEPNIKNSAGTLRDIHTMYYLALLDIIAASAVSTHSWPHVRDVLSMVSLKETRRHALIAAYDFFLAVRSCMHELSGHLHDSLDFELQRGVSESMGFTSPDSRAGVERFMRSYYTHARAVHVAGQLVFYDERKKLGLKQREHAAMLMLPEDGRALDDRDVMSLFLDMTRQGSRPAGEVIRALDHLRGTAFRPEAIRMFDDILRQGGQVADTLMFMHEHGMLAAVLPEFAALEHFFQHNIYHFFTADEHTLRAVRAIETSMRDDAHTARVLSELHDISVLYYAVLLHDIAKPIDLPRHEHVAADMAPDILRRYGRQDITETVSFLVREHLRMEQLAFRRNFREITALRPFIDLVGTVERLNLLYLLTIADMSALNPGVLTGWKRVLLRELYETSKAVLETGEMAELQLQQKIDIEHPSSVLSEEEISTAVQDIIDGELVRIHLQHHRAYSEVTVFCLDRPQLLAQFSAALFGADCSIVDASIETRQDVVIDTFRIVDIFSGGHLGSEQSLLLKNMIRAVCAGAIDAEQLFERHRRKWVRRLRKLPKTHVTVDVTYHPHLTANGREQTIVEVYAPDTFGLLFRLSAELSSFGLNVVFAKIATRVDGVVDSFYVVDGEGRAFTDAARREELRLRLMKQIHILTQ